MGLNTKVPTLENGCKQYVFPLYCGCLLGKRMFKMVFCAQKNCYPPKFGTILYYTFKILIHEFVLYIPLVIGLHVQIHCTRDGDP